MDKFQAYIIKINQRDLRKGPEEDFLLVDILKT